MNAKKILALMLGAMMLLSLAACGAKDNDKQADMSGDGSAMTGEPKTAEEALTLHKELLERENALLSENAELWEKVFMAADKGMTMQEDGKNYGDFLLKTIEDAKEEFSDEEYEWLKESATEISNIENKLTELEEKYPEIMQKSMDGDMSMPAGSDTSTPPDDGSMQKFPAFEGKDLDGNTVKSDELFSGNAVTVVNFWFTTCNPCVGELADLDALNRELACFNPTRLATSPWVRCQETLEMFAWQTGRDMVHLDPLTEDAYAAAPDTAWECLLSEIEFALERRQPIAICMHRPVIGGMFGHLRSMCVAPSLSKRLIAKTPFMPTGTAVALFVTPTPHGPKIIDIQKVQPLVY
mgnify:CR=1 FL=1